MRSYFIKLSQREEGPLTEEEVAQFFADGRIERDTPCRVGLDGPWRTIDDLLPMLKYGTQLPNPTRAPVVRSEDSPVYRAGPFPPRPPQSQSQPDMRVSVVDFDLPFGSILKLMFKWMAAGFLVSLCFVPVIMLLILIVMAIFGSLLGGMLSGIHHP
jgi:hypothetical protein